MRGNRTSGSEGGPGKRTGRKATPAPRSDPTTPLALPSLRRARTSRPPRNASVTPTPEQALAVYAQATKEADREAAERLGQCFRPRVGGGMNP